MSVMASYTAAPDEDLLPSILRDLNRIPEVLVVLNHPYWLEEGVTESAHQRALARVLRECLGGFHAFELNGTRRWSENAAVIDLARQYSRPVISGGDRHACEPSACLNLTHASTFAEFAAELRSGHSHVLFMPHYREPMPLRILEAAWDILRPYPEYPGRERWTQRIFYRGEDGVARPLSVVWKKSGAPVHPPCDRNASALRDARSPLHPAPPNGPRSRGPAMRAAAERLLALWEEPQDLALVVAIGCVLGTFPVYGVPTLLCIIAARALRVNAVALLAGEPTH